MERKYVERLKYNFAIPKKIKNLMSIPPKQLGPQWYILKALWESRKNMTTKTLWKRICEEEDSLRAVKSRSHLIRLLEQFILAKGKAIRAQSDEFPQFKKSGWKIIPNKAFRSTPPCLLVTLNPIPVIQRSEYVMYLLRMNKAYEIFPKDQHDYVDSVAYKWRKVSDDCKELMEILEDANHPIRGERLRIKSRFELFEETLNNQQKEALFNELNNNQTNLEEMNQEVQEGNDLETNENLSLEQLRELPEVKHSSYARYYLDKLSKNDVPDKSISDLENEDELEIEEFYKRWKERLSSK